VASSALPFLTCGVFAWLLARLGVHSVTSALLLAVAWWLIGQLPLILTMRPSLSFTASLPFLTLWDG
jgi:hypothetical protein